MSQEASNKALMLSVLAAFKDGNLEPLFEAISPDVVWKASAPPEFFRFGGVYKGIAGIKEYTALLVFALSLHALRAQDRHRAPATKSGACSRPRRCTSPAAAMCGSTFPSAGR